MPRIVEATKEVFIVGGTEGRNPFEVLILVWAIIGGASRLVGMNFGNETVVHLPDWVVTVWYMLLCIGGLVGLVGVWIRETLTSLLVERAGMLFLGPVGVAYSLALLIAGGDGIALAVSTFMFAVTAIGRLLRIWWWIHRLRSTLSNAVSEEP